MSLTQMLESKNFKKLRDKLKEDFPRPKIQITGELVAPPETKNYGIIGAAFDYLLRFSLEREYKNKIEPDNNWIATKAVDRIKKETESKIKSLPKLLPIEDAGMTEKEKKYNKGLNDMVVRRAKKINSLCEKVRDLHDEARSNYKDYLKNGNLTEALIKSSIALARLDLYVRAKLIDESISTPDEKDVSDLKRLIWAVNIQDFAPKTKCYLNPTFGEGSLLFFGADADLIVDDTLIEIKTTKHLKITRDYLNQLVCYVVASRIGGINSDLEKRNSIRKIGIYFSRFGLLWTIPLSEFADEDKFEEFKNWLMNYLDG